jgi:hypothetical protein
MAASLDARASLRRNTIAPLLTVSMLAASLSLSSPPSNAQTSLESSPSAPTIDRIAIVRENVFNSVEKRAGILGDTRLFGEPWSAAIGRVAGPGGLDLAGWANRLHFKTQPSVIEPELLFSRGQLLDSSHLMETERNLRSLGFLRNASVTSRMTPAGKADVTVLTQDAWTTIPLLGFSDLGGGHVTGEVGITESNLFGFGKTAQFVSRSERYRDVNFIGYDDPRILGSHWHLVGQGSEDSDGRVRGALLEYPFWSLEVPTSVGGSFSYVIDRERLFSQHHNLFRHWQTAAAFEAAHALVADQRLVRRIGLRYQLWDDSFRPPPADAGPSAVGLRDRRTSALELTFTEWHPDFVKAYYLDQLGHPEDRDIGWALQTRLGYSPSALAASRSELVIGTAASAAFHVNDKSYGWLWLQASGREGGGRVRDGFLTLEGIAYQRLGDLLNHGQTLVVDARADLSSGLYRDHEFVIGSDDGRLRGYPINYAAGTRRMLLHVDDRVAVVEDLLHLISLGVVVFGDAGQVWGRGRTLSASGMLASVGVGLRMSSTRSRFQLPIRFDFAIALFHHAGVSAADFSTGAPQEFGQFGQPYAAESNSISDPETLAPDSAASPYPHASPFTYPGNSFTGY